MAHSEETKRKISIALMGHKVSLSSKMKMRGRKLTEEQRSRISKACIGRIPWNKGKVGIYSPETLSKIRTNTKKAMAKIKWTERQRFLMGNSRRGVTDSAEMREKNRQGQYKRYARTIIGYNQEDDGRRTRRKLRLRKNGGFHSKKEWESLKRNYGFACAFCLKKEIVSPLTKDHIIPVLLGGTDDIKNIRPLCRPCNSSRPKGI